MAAALASSTLTEAQLKSLVSIEGDVQLKAAQLGMLCSEYRQNITRVLLHFEPIISPLRAIIYAGVQKKKDIETQLIYLERVIILQERRGGVRQLPLRELQTIEKDLLQPIHKEMQDSYQQLSNVTREELQILREYECPPKQALNTMAMAMRVRGEENTEWPAVQIILSESYFFTFFISRAQTLLLRELENDVFEELQHFCYLPEYAPEALALISIPLGAIGQWLHAVFNYYKIKKIIAPTNPSISVDERRQMVTRLRHELQTIKENINRANEEIKTIQKETMRKVMEVRNEYDDTMCPLHDSLEKKTEDFIKTLGGIDINDEDNEEEQQKEIEEEEEENKKNIKEQENTEEMPIEQAVIN